MRKRPTRKPPQRDRSVKETVDEMNTLVKVVNKPKTRETLEELREYLQERGYERTNEVIGALSDEWFLHRKNRDDSRQNTKEPQKTSGVRGRKPVFTTDPVLDYFHRAYNLPEVDERTRFHIENAMNIVRLHRYLELLETEEATKARIKAKAGLSGKSKAWADRVIENSDATLAELKRVLGEDESSIKDLERRVKRIKWIIEKYKQQNKIWW